MNVKFKDRFGNEVSFDKKERVFEQRPGESFMTALVRTYYPRDYERHQRLREERGDDRNK